MKVARVATELFPLHKFVPAQSLYHKTVVSAPAKPVKSTGLRALKSASSNSKLSGGKANAVFVKGPWVGMPMYQLTLEERATCPNTCAQFLTCYGNNMPFATRHNTRGLTAALRADLAVLADKHPAGFVVRLHVLGDFYSVEYVEFWATQIRDVPQLRIFGYTHREFGTPIGDAVTQLVTKNPGRVSILRSDGTNPADPLQRAMSIDADATEPHPLARVICPEQTGKTESCLTCGLCMGGKVSVSFMSHGKIPQSFVNIATKRQKRAA